MTSIKKRGFTMRVSWDYLFHDASHYDPRYVRKEKSRTTIPVTDEQWADYEKAKAALEYLGSYPGFYLDNEDLYLVEPQPKVVIEYAETHDEWIARCREMW